MRNTNFYKTFISFRDQIRSSIDAQNNLIVGVTDKMDDLTSTFSSATATLSDGLHSVSFDDLGSTIRITCSEWVDEETSTEDSVTLDPSADNFLNQIVPLSGLTVAQVLSDINDSEKLNSALDTINTQMLNYGAMEGNFLRSVLAKLDSMGGGVVEYLNSTIGVVPEECDPYVWSSVISNLENPLKEQAEGYSNFDLEVKYVSIKQFVGGAILSAIGTMLQVVAFILRGILKVLGFIASIVVNALSWLTNQVVNTHFTATFKGVDNSLDTPFIATTGTLVQPIEDYIGESVVKRNSTPGLYKEYWRNDTDYFCNAFVTIEIDGEKFGKWLYEQLEATVSYETITSPSTYYVRFKTAKLSAVIATLVNDGIPSELLLSDGDAPFAMTDDQIGSSIAASMIYNFLIRGCGIYDDTLEYTSFHWSPTHVDTISTLSDLPEWFNSVFARLLCEHSGTPTVDVWSYYLTSLGNFNNYLLSLNGSASSNIRDMNYFNGDGSIILTTLPFSISPAVNFADVEDSVSDCPNTNHTVSWPAYSNAALLNSLAIFSAICVVGVATYSLGRIAVSRLKTNYQLKSIKHLTQLRENYEESGSDQDLKALTKAARKYNFKAKLFGLQTYDVGNNWLNDYGSASEANEGVFDNIIQGEQNNEDILAIQKLITG